MRDFSKEVTENKNLETSIEVAKTLRDKSLKEMSKDVYDILSEIYKDGTKYVTYVTQVCIKQDSDLWKKGFQTFFFRDDSVGSFIKVNEIEVRKGEKRVIYRGIAIDIDKENLPYYVANGKTSVYDSDLKEFFRQLDTILKVGKENLVGIAEYTIEEKLKSDKVSLQKKFNEVSCSVSK